MQAFDEFRNMPPEFWAFIKFVGDKLKYTAKKTKANPDPTVKIFTYEELHDLIVKYDINVSDDILYAAVHYIRLRADALNSFVRTALMNGEEARKLYLQFSDQYANEELESKIPHNLQTGDKKQTAYFTALINLLTELHIKYNTEIWPYMKPGFDCDPHNLMFVFDKNNDALLGAASRRFDGAYPSTMHPKIVWEIKEYYYTTTFGSRVADGVYETELDGFELKEIYDRTGIKIFHVLFVDAYDTWWGKGRSYLCRIIDILNAGLVDEVIFGREIMTRWPELLKELIV